MYQVTDAVDMGPEWSDHADRALESLIDDDAPHLGHYRLGFGRVESAAARGPYHFAFHVHPPHRRTPHAPGRLRALHSFMIGRTPQAPPVHVPVGKRDDIAMRPVMIPQVHDILVAAETPGQVKQRVHRIRPGRASL